VPPFLKEVKDRLENGLGPDRRGYQKRRAKKKRETGREVNGLDDAGTREVVELRAAHARRGRALDSSWGQEKKPTICPRHSACCKEQRCLGKEGTASGLKEAEKGESFTDGSEKRRGIEEGNPLTTDMPKSHGQGSN